MRRRPARMLLASGLLAGVFAGAGYGAPACAAGRTLASAAREVLDQPRRDALPLGRSAKAAPHVSGPEGEAAAQADYLLHCSGCHGERGEPLQLGRIPPLQGRLGQFLHLPEGRAFLVQVPGVNNAHLDDAAIARLMNWLVPAFAGASLRSEFAPFTAREVGELRARRPTDPAAYRRVLARRLADLVFSIDY